MMRALRLDRALLACGAIGAPLFVAVFLVEDASRPALIGAGLFPTDPISGALRRCRTAPLTAHCTVPSRCSFSRRCPLPACSVIAYWFASSGRRGGAAYSVGTATAFLSDLFLSAWGSRATPRSCRSGVCCNASRSSSDGHGSLRRHCTCSVEPAKYHRSPRELSPEVRRTGGAEDRAQPSSRLGAKPVPR